MRTTTLAIVLLGLHACGNELECGDGTVERGKVCVPDDDLCPTGEVWDDGACRSATACGAGTINVGGECVVDNDVCEAGEVFVGGDCIEQCGAGTLVEVATGSCVPVDPIAGMDGEVEPNDPVRVGVGSANPISLPAQGRDVRVTGAIGAPADLDGDGVLDSDFDGFVFDGAAGTRLHIEVTAVGAPEVAFVLVPVDDTWARFAYPVAQRNAARQVVLPATGSYILLVGEGSALLGDAVGWSGGAGFTYVAAITPVANPAPTATAGGFESAGDLRDLPQFLVDVSAGTFVEMWMDVDSDDTDGRLWFASADYAEWIGEVRHTLDPVWFQVPSGGLLVTADFESNRDGDTGYRLRSIEHPVTVLDLSAPVARPADVVPAGGARFYAMHLVEDRVVHVSANLALGDAEVELVVLDDDLSPMAVSNIAGPVRSLTVALVAGDYTLAAYESSLADVPGVFEMDLAADSWPLVSAGVVDGSTAVIDVLDIALEAPGARAFFRLDAGAIGEADITVTPSSAVDVAVAFYGGPQLDAGGLSTAAALVDDQGPDGAETLSFSLVPRRYFIEVEAVTETAHPPGSDADLHVDFAASTIANLLEGAATPTEPTDLGTLSTVPVLAIGDVVRDAAGLTFDFWRFTLAGPGRVRLETAPYGNGADDTRLVVMGLDGAVFAVDDDGGVANYSRVEVVLPAGDYLLSVSEDAQRDGGHYILEAVVEAELLCAPGETACVGGELLSCDAGGLTQTARTCALGCDGDVCDGLAEIEGNDSWVDAQDLDGEGDNEAAIEAGVTVVHGAIDDVVAGRDMDWYAFTLESAAVVSVSTSSTIWLDTELWLYEVSAAPPGILELANNDNAPGTVWSHIGPETLPAGDYWLRVGYAADRPALTGLYDLVIEVEPLVCFPDVAACSGDTLELCNATGSEFFSLSCFTTCTAGGCDFVLEAEPNDVDTQAQDFGAVVLDTRIVAGGEVANPSDRDWFRFEVGGDALVRIETVDTSSGGDADTRLSLYLASDTVTPIASDDDGGSGSYSLIDTFLTAGAYYVTVAGSDNGFYNLVIDIRVPECDGSATRCEANRLDACELGRWVAWSCLATCAGTPAACDLLADPVTFDATFSGGDTAVYRFGADLGDKLTFASTPAASLDTRLFLCNAATAQCDFFSGWLTRVDSVGVGDVDEMVEWIAPVGGEYVLGVEAANGSGVAQVTVTPLPVPKALSVDMPVVARGGAVVVSGRNFTDVDTITMGGVAVADFTVDSDAQISIHEVPDSAPVGLEVPLALTSPSLGTSSPFAITVINLLLSEIDAQNAGSDIAEMIEVSTGFPGLDMTGAGYVVVFVSGNDTTAGEAYRSGIPLDAVANGDGLIVLGNAATSPDIVFGDGVLQNGFDGVAIVQAASLSNGSDVSAERIVDAVAYDTAGPGSGQGQAINVEFLWSTGSGVIDESAEGDSFQRCALGRRDIGAWAVVAAPTPAAINDCSVGNSTNSYAVPGLPMNLPTPGSVCVDVAVPALPFGNSVTQVRATAALAHGFAGDIEITIRNPASTTVVLIDRVGTVYDLQAAFPLGFADGGTPLADIATTVVAGVVCGGGACTFAPEEPLTGLNGAQSVGTWTACFIDHNLNFGGQASSFALELTTGP